MSCGKPIIMRLSASKGGKAPKNALKSQHIPLLDEFRFIAILLVFFYHAYGMAFGRVDPPYAGWVRNFSLDLPFSFWVLYLLSYGWSGVTLFFVLSGFCIHLPYARNRRFQFKEFIARRFFRIYPTYFVCLVSLFILNLLINYNSAVSVKYHAYNLLSHVFLFHNLHDKTFFSINGPFWSLAAEAQLYLLFPLVLWAINKLGRNTMLWLSLLISLASRLISSLFLNWSHVETLLTPLAVSFFTLNFWFVWCLGPGLPINMQKVIFWNITAQ